MNDIIHKLWLCKYSILFYVIYELLQKYIVRSDWYSSSMLFYFPNLQKIDIHIKDRIFKFCLVALLYIIYVIITKELSITPNNTSLIDFSNGTLIGLFVISVHSILSILTGSIKIVGFDFNYKLILNVIYIYLIGCILTSFTEELILRGILQNTFTTYFNKNIIIICLALFFGIWHIRAGILYAIGATIYGLLAGMLYIKKGFYICFGLHFGHNFFESLFNSQTIIRYKNSRPFWNGYRNTPDETGCIDLILYLILTIYFYTVYYKDYV